MDSNSYLNQNQFSSNQPFTPEENQSFWEKARGIISSLLILLIAPLLALFLTFFVFQTYEVDGPSMESTLQHKDRLIVLKLPRTWASFLRRDYIPKRGEIIIFQTEDYIGSGSSSRQLIKRVIGIPGDRVLINDGVVTVINNENPNGFLPDKTLGYQIDKNIRTTGNVDIRIEEGEVFVLGDNRENSLDSRVFGAIPAKEIVGKLSLRIYPVNKIERY